MASEDQLNPEWTAQDFAEARPAAEILPTTFMASRKPGRPQGSFKADAKQQVTLRLDRDVLDRFRATGPGWQARINEALRKVG